MSSLASETSRKKLPTIILVLLIVAAALLGGGYYLAPRFERVPPQIKLPDAGVLGLAPMEIVVTDAGAGLKSVSATLSIGGAGHTLKYMSSSHG